MFLFGDVVGAVVVELVVVPGDQPRAGRMHVLEVLVASILGVAGTVVVECFDFRSVMLPDTSIPPRVFVNVIAEVKDEVRGVGCHLLVGSEEALFEILAGRDRKAEFGRGRPGGGKGARATGPGRGPT